MRGLRDESHQWHVAVVARIPTEPRTRTTTCSACAVLVPVSKLANTLLSPDPELGLGLAVAQKELRQVCQSYHYVTAATRRVVGSDFNSACLRCTCKGFHLYGICSHVVAVNDILGKVDLSDSLKELCQPRKTGGFRKGVRPALIQEKEAASDSSEDEPLTKRVKKLQKKGGLQLP